MSKPVKTNESFWCQIDVEFWINIYVMGQWSYVKMILNLWSVSRKMGIDVEEQVTRKTYEWKNTHFSFLTKIFCIWDKLLFGSRKLISDFLHQKYFHTSTTSLSQTQRYNLDTFAFSNTASSWLPFFNRLRPCSNERKNSSKQNNAWSYQTINVQKFNTVQKIQKSVVIYVAIICSIRNNEYPCNPHAKRRLKCK